jgi:hypothetical protein
MYDYDNTDQLNKNIHVSNEFVDIYTNFNVVTQVEKMKQLTKRELYLLLTVCLDKFSDEDPVVKHNLLPFKEEKLPEPLTKDQVRDAKINIINED